MCGSSPRVIQLPAAAQAPPEHTMPGPQKVPSATAEPVSVHTGEPVAQESAPRWQTLVGAHAAPAVQAAQVPALVHTWPVPQDRPAGALPVAMHTSVLVEQLVTPRRHGLAAGTHDRPGVQVRQSPALHTRLVPHAVPLGRWA